MTTTKGYLVKLTFNQVAALVDIDENYIGDDSPRFNLNTLRALERRRLIYKLPPKDKQKEIKKRKGWIVARLTKKGRAYLSMAAWEYNENKEVFEELRIAGGAS